jgi:hypothetical protein
MTEASVAGLAVPVVLQAVIAYTVEEMRIDTPILRAKEYRAAIEQPPAVDECGRAEPQTAILSDLLFID